MLVSRCDNYYNVDCICLLVATLWLSWCGVVVRC